LRRSAVAVRVATFNVENLFARFKFAEKSPEEAKEDTDLGWTIEEGSFVGFSGPERELTERTLKALDADVIAFQEVESLDTLKRFRSEHLGGPSEWPYPLVIDGNDTRRIDVAILSKLPIVHIQSHQYLRAGSGYLFSRDCLEADLDVGDEKPLTLFVNHLKSMLDKSDPQNGRRNTHERRKLQAETVRELVTQRFGGDVGDESFIVLGDLNDYLATDEQGSTAIADLVQWNQLENVVDRLPEEERWTHFYRGAVHQLDYLLPSKSLAEGSPSEPEIIRGGLPPAASAYTGERFIDGMPDLHDRLLADLKDLGRVPEDATELPAAVLRELKASDHCPVVTELSV
jgi:endonuclease/exonuclease/phosphatase family metal-dependent hydrolase